MEIDKIGIGDASREAGVPTLTKEGATAIVTLRRPAQANRLQPEDIVQLQTIWELLKEDTSLRAVVLTSTGKYFSAGYDLISILETVDAGNELTSIRKAVDPPSPTEVVVGAFASMVDALERLPQVTVCALNGSVYGGATDLALACDFRYGVSTCEMSIPASRLGLQFYLAGLRRYVSRLGLDNAKRLLLLAEKLDAKQMLAIGFLHRIVPAGDLLPQALETARLAGYLAPMATSGMKAALNSIAADHIDEGAVRLGEMRALHSHDLREGVAAWGEKRPPSFVGA